MPAIGLGLFEADNAFQFYRFIMPGLAGQVAAQVAIFDMK